MKETYKINREKFLGELKKRNITMADIAKEMGRSSKYISNKVRETGEFSKSDVSFINAVFHLPYESYKYEEKKVTDQVTIANTTVDGKPVILNLPQEELKQLIYEAVYEAIKNATDYYGLNFIPRIPEPPYDFTCNEQNTLKTQETLPFT